MVDFGYDLDIVPSVVRWQRRLAEKFRQAAQIAWAALDRQTGGLDNRR